MEFGRSRHRSLPRDHAMAIAAEHLRRTAARLPFQSRILVYPNEKNGEVKDKLLEWPSRFCDVSGSVATRNGGVSRENYEGMLERSKGKLTISISKHPYNQT